MTLNSEALLPCPLCNCGMMLDRFVDWEGQPLANQVIIHPSPSECPLVDIQIDATPEAIAAWNRRPALPSGDELVERLDYMVENPSAWSDGFDQGASDLIREANTRFQSLLAEVAASERSHAAARENFLTMQGAAASLLKRAENAEAEVERVKGERDEARAHQVRCATGWADALNDLDAAEARVKVLEDGFRDKIALGASDADIQRFRDSYPNPAGGSKILYRYSIEQARYRYADAMLAARALNAIGRTGE